MSNNNYRRPVTDVDTDYESADETSYLGGLWTALTGTNSGQTSYDILATNCGGNASNLKNWAKIRRLKSTCRRYKDVYQYVQNSKGSSTITVNNIYHIKRHNERKPFERTLYRMMLWHGTSPQAIAGIVQNGFQKGRGGLYGSGVYFADRIAKSIGYCRQNTSRIGYFVLAEVELGRVYKAHHTHSEYLTAPAGFETVKGNGRDIPKWRENKKYHGAILPCGITVPNQRHAQYDLPYNEYIVYDSNRIIVRFVVECQF